MISFWKATLRPKSIAKRDFERIVWLWHNEAHPSCKATLAKPCSRIAAFLDGIKFSLVGDGARDLISYSFDAEVLVRQEG